MEREMESETVGNLWQSNGNGKKIPKRSHDTGADKLLPKWLALTSEW